MSKEMESNVYQIKVNDMIKLFTTMYAKQNPKPLCHYP